jgi:hypothetical protein
VPSHRGGGGNAPPASKATLIDAAVREHDFGSVLGGAGRTRTHRYRLANWTGRPVRVEVVNLRPCCGSAEVGRATLAPAEATDVAVTVRLDGATADLVHEVGVSASGGVAERFVLRTTARVHPALRLEEVTAAGGAVLLSTEGPRRAEFRVVAHGTAAEPPIDLGAVDLAPEGEARWTGPTEVRAAPPGGVSAHVRRFATALDAGPPAGPRSRTILLRAGAATLLERAIGWEVVTPIHATPRSVVFVPGLAERRVLLRATDGRPFRVLRLESACPGVRGRAAAGDAAAPVQTVVLTADEAAAGEGRRGALTIDTDHPAQGRVELPVSFYR